MFQQVADGVCFVLRFERKSPRKNGLNSTRGTSPQSGNRWNTRNGAQMTPVLEQDLDFMGIRATSYFYSPCFNYSLRYDLVNKDAGFKIDLKDDVLQLYRGEKRQTFIQFKLKETVGEAVKRKNFRNVGCFLEKEKGSKNRTIIPGRDITSGSNGSPKGQISDPEANSQMHSISVDLTSFSNNILNNQQKGRHPLVRKTPVLAIEAFVFNRKNEFQVNPIGVAYFDILCGNQLSIPYTSGGIEAHDFEQNDPSDNPVASLEQFEKLLEIHQINDSSISNSEGDVTNTGIVSKITSFLENVTYTMKTRPLTKKMEKKLLNVMNSLTEELQNETTLLVKVSRLLCSLGMFNMVEEILQIVSECKKSVEGDAEEKTDLVCASKFCADWKLLAVDFCLNRKISQKVLETLTVKCKDEKPEQQCAEKKYSHQNILEKYVLDAVKKEHSSLIEEFDEKQLQLHRENSSFPRHNQFLGIDTPETIGNLRIERDISYQQTEIASGENDGDDKNSKQKGKENEITLFRLNILPFKIHHWNNQFVILMRQPENAHAENLGEDDVTENGKKVKTANDNEIFLGNLDDPDEYPILAKSVESRNAIKVWKHKTRNEDDIIVNTRCKEQVVCIGRVVRVQEVPFNITVKIEAESDEFKNKKDASLFPDVLRGCLVGESGNPESAPIMLKWRLTLVQANVVTYSRIMDTLKVLASHDISNTKEIDFDTAKKYDIISANDDATPTGDHVTATGNDVKREDSCVILAGDCSSDVITGKEPSTSSCSNFTTDDVSSSKNSKESKKRISKSFNNQIVRLLIYPTLSEIEIPQQSIANSGLQHESFKKSLNESQQKAVELARSNRISLIHGPPGTGKSTTACAIVRDVLLNFGYGKILICAETNLAVDNLLMKFKQTATKDEKDLKLLRLNSQQGREMRNPDVESDPSLQELSLEWKIKKTVGNDIRRFSNFRSSAEKKAARKIIEESRIIFTTCAGAGDPLLDHNQFEFVLIDEATMSRETTSLCSLAHGCKHLVLIGDPNQLGPTNRLTGDLEKDRSENSQSDKEESAGEEKKNIPETLFHKFHALPEVFKTAFLNTQHRMHSQLAQFPSKEFYDSKLKSANYIDDHRRFEFRPDSKYFDQTKILKWWPVSKSGRREALAPLCFIDVPDGTEQRRGTSFYNEAEAKICCKVWLDILLVQAVGSFKNIAILTLYKGQVEKLKEQFTNLIKDLKNRFPLAESKLPTHLPEINSVDSYQGRENDIILVSTVRTKDKLGFSGDPNRINVLLTRGKKILCVIGNQNTLKNSPEDSEKYWQRWFEQVDVVKASKVLDEKSE